MKPFLTEEQAEEIVEGFHKELRSSGRPSARDDLRAALEPLTIAPPKPKFRVGQYARLGNREHAYRIASATANAPFAYRFSDSLNWWDESLLRPLTAAEIEGPKEEA